MKKWVRKFVVMSAAAFSIAGLCSVSAFASDDFESGIFNLNLTAQNSAQVGSFLANPEIGWNRYDDLNPKILYEGNWKHCYCNGAINVYKGTYAHAFQQPGCKIKFKFFGSKIRIITFVGTIAGGANIKIDNIDYGNYNCYSTGDQANNHILFEKSGLNDGIHEIVITTLSKNSFVTQASASWFTLDAIDIDGYLLPYNDSFTLNKSQLNLQKSNFEKLTVSLPDNVDMVWSSSDENVAIVDYYGKVTAVNEGNAVITAKIKGEENITSSCNVVVGADNAGTNAGTGSSLVNVPSNSTENINDATSTTEGGLNNQVSPDTTTSPSVEDTTTTDNMGSTNLPWDGETTTGPAAEDTTTTTDTESHVNLYIAMSDGDIKQAKDINISDFINWYRNRDLGKTELPFYEIINQNGENEYLIHDKIISFLAV